MNIFGNIQWTQEYTTTLLTEYENLSFTIDRNSCIYIITSLDSSLPVLSGTYDIVLLKIDMYGHILAKYKPLNNIIGAKYNPVLTSDSLGALYIIYEIKHVVNETDTYMNVTKLDNNGIVSWTFSQKLLNDCSVNGYKSILTDVLCNTYVIYNIYDSLSDRYNMVLIKLNPHGDLLWSKDNIFATLMDTNNQVSFTIDLNNNIYLVYQNINNDHNQILMNDVIVAKIDENGNILWLYQHPILNMVEYEVHSSIISDENSNVYIVYNDNQEQCDEYNLIIFKLDTHGRLQWVKQQPSIGINESYFTSKIAIDSTGNLYFTFEYFSNELSRLGVSIVKMSTEGELLGISSQSIVFVSKDLVYPEIQIDKRGNIYTLHGQNCRKSNYLVERSLIVSKFLPCMEKLPVLAIDNNNNIYYAYFVNSNPKECNIVITKKDNCGNTIWSICDPSFNTNCGSSHPCITLYNNSCYVVYHTLGVTSGSIQTGLSDIVVLKLNENGHVIWVQQQSSFNTPKNNELPSIDVDSDGNLYIAYQTHSLQSAQGNGLYDIVIFKMNCDGKLKWIRRGLNKYQNNLSPHLKCDHQQNVLYIAYVNNNNQMIEYNDIVVIKLDLNGELCMNLYGQIWSIKRELLNTHLNDIDPVICLDGVGNIYLCYVTNGSVMGCTNTGNYDIVVCKINSEGNISKMIQSDIFNTCEDDIHPSISYKEGHIYIAYQTSGSVLGQSKIGCSDVVVMKLSAITFEIIWIQQKLRLNTVLDNLNPQIGNDAIGNSYIVYETTGDIFGQIFSGQGTKIIVAKLNKYGSTDWIRR